MCFMSRRFIRIPLMRSADYPRSDLGFYVIPKGPKSVFLQAELL